MPLLIYALTDPDWRVVKEARDGLRFFSRKFRGFGLDYMPRISPQATKAQREQAMTNWHNAQLKAQQEWKAWYLSVRPDGELLE